MVAMGETITIVNKSGKVVSTSKHLVNIFNEAKSAYNQRKAELKAFRRNQQGGRKDDERTARRRLDALTLADDDSTYRHHSRRGSDSGRSTSRGHASERGARRPRPPIERGVTDSFYTNDRRSKRDSPPRSSQAPSPLRQQVDTSPRAGELTRRHTDDVAFRSHRSPRSRRASLDDIDMDLAYGELPPPLPERKYDEEIELRAKMSGLQRLLDECNCLQHSVTAIIENLQKNPDALAAVAVTLAEISNLLSKMAPGALAGLKGAFPAGVALLASPEFAIAIGVGVGVTIIALGGYKIIKKIKARKEEELQPHKAIELRRRKSTDSELETVKELDRVEAWRRGIDGDDAESVGTSVEGEIITPRAAKTLMEEGRFHESDLQSRTGSDAQKKRSKKHRSSGSERGSEKTSRSSKGRSDVHAKSKTEHGGLRMLFKK
ncbi:hypothetical protein BDY17DRAFT_293700 [Neohortaea acidophila]|uniref:Uncharacterized protein n=1 Tax=Neohortaea acidophila TaxID=245834 RepID=A0A6A6PZN1_9PEZI|nr:uncharacterized protein BDY17DRAFT_293700 [Neohortaea acidophila]KAF2485485.1 hypothetical protein BDY17DRAFT_293700 [Neohortaea acidophila]